MIEQRRLEIMAWARETFTEEHYFVPMARHHRVRVPTVQEQESILRRAIRAIGSWEALGVGPAVRSGAARFFRDYVNQERKRVRHSRRRRARAFSVIGA